MFQMATFGVTQQMTPKSSGCPSNGYGEPLLRANEECKSSLTDFVAPSTSINLLAINSMCSMSAEKSDGHLYKRRKMDKESNALLADENTTKSTTRSCTTFGENSSLVQNGDGKSPIIPLNVPVPKSGGNNVDSAMEYEEPAEASNGDLWKTSLEPHSGVEDRWSSSVSGMPSSAGLEKKDAGESSSSDTNGTEPITELTSARKLCTSMLKSDEFPNNGPGTRGMSGSIEGPHDQDANYLFACKNCGFSEDPLKMLICDSCEAAFHLSCCYPCIKEIPIEEWYCLCCLRKKKPKRLCGKLLTAKGGSSEHIQRPRQGLGPIEYMLKDIEPHVSEVRIGRDFQAEVPEWSGPTSSDDGYFDEPFELDPTEPSDLNHSKRNNQNKPSMGNWIQCREVLNTGETNKPVVCGKWRRNWRLLKFLSN